VPGRDKVNALPLLRALGMGTLVASALAACGPDPSTARGTAERFLDAHYVTIELASALPYTSGLARQKVEREMELVKGVPIDDTTVKPIVRYRLIKEDRDPAGANHFLYRGTIVVDGDDGFDRQWLVTVRHEEEGFRVTNYQEFGE
jgi:hypothetical protein